MKNEASVWLILAMCSAIVEFFAKLFVAAKLKPVVKITRFDFLTKYFVY